MDASRLSRKSRREGGVRREVIDGRRERRRPRKPGQRNWWPLALGGAVVAILAVGLVVFVLTHGNQQSPATGSSAESSPPVTGQMIGSIRCETHEQGGYHIHAHVAIFVNGQPAQIPAGIGIPNPQVEQSARGPVVGSGSCFYWLHSHTPDGIVHVESPVERTFTLGEYFDVWGQPLTADRVAADRGQVTAYLTGQKFSGDPRSIPLTSHAVIQLDVGGDVPPAPFAFPPGL